MPRPPLHPSTVLTYVGDSHTQNTQASYTSILSHFTCVLCGNFNCSQRMLSHVTSIDVSKLWSLCSSPLSFLAHTLATRSFCDLLSCPQPLSTGSDFLGAIYLTLPLQFLSSFCLSPPSCPAEEGNRTVSFRLRRFGFASTGDYEQGTKVFQNSVFSCAEVALCGVLGIADVLFVKALATLFSNGVNFPVNFERF